MRHKHGFRNLLWVILLALVAALGILGWSGYQLFSQAKQVKKHEEKAIEMLARSSTLSDGSVLDGYIKQQLPVISKETREAKVIAHGTLWNAAARTPVYGNDLKTVQGMTDSLDAIVTGPVPELLTVASNLEHSQLSSGDGRLNVEPILRSQKSIAAGSADMHKQVVTYNNLPLPRGAFVKDAYLSGRTTLNQVSAQIQQFSNSFQMLPQFLGADKPQTFALLAMTTSEARSSGGLIGSIGVITTDKGEISVGNFKPNTDYLSYGIGNPTPDEVNVFRQWGPLQMSFDVRDLAVYPDTSRSAESMQAIWQRTPWGSKQPIDGVILVDPVFLQELIKINGDIKLSDGRVLSGQNTAEFLLNTVYKEYAPTQQDMYFQQVAEASIGGMFSQINMSKLTKVAQVMSSSAEGRHFSMYVFDKNMETTIAAAGFTAQSSSSAEHPTVGVYSTEQNASKMDWYIHRRAKVTRMHCHSNGSQTYHVYYTMTNTLNSQEVSSLPAYIVGINQAGQPQGYGIEKMLIYPPADGAISNLKTDGTVSELHKTEMNGKTLYASIASLAPGASVTYSFDVTTSQKTISDLRVDQTPMGWMDSGPSFDGSACSASGH
ncbi:DUF4012 domain-containing protein [Bifidobacterium xylocopae]|uniref:DUF4012 domain-containing protein n=1 Tax=Bifidobacterium xylocopae TaxID=2493119 RepID=UPI001F3B25B4|nr:DUF4012 domain-containing protein [Bifidobacterium xylocopae]